MVSDDFRIHDLRHTAASLMIQPGYPPKLLQEIMGHASITRTLHLYGHVYPGDMGRYADLLGTRRRDRQSGQNCGHRPLLIARSYPHKVTLPLVNPDRSCHAKPIPHVAVMLPSSLGNQRLVQALTGKPIRFRISRS